MYIMWNIMIKSFSELVKNKTLEFFSRTLPILKADETIPKVAKYVPPDSYYQSSTTQKYLQ